MRHATRRKPAHRAHRRMGTLAKIGAALAAPFPDAELLVAQMANPDSGIRFVLGIVKRAGKRASEVQSVIFDKLKWTADAAKVWLRDHGFTSPKVDEGATFWRFRQQQPGKYKEFRTVVPGTQQGNPQLKFGRTPYDLVPDKMERYHVVNAGGYIVAKHDTQYIADDVARMKSEDEPSDNFRVVDTRTGRAVSKWDNGEERDVEENPGPWPKVYKTMAAAKSAWYDSMPGRNDRATYIKVRGGYRVVPEGRFGGRGHYGTTVDDMERGDTGFVDNPEGEGSHYAVVDGVRIGLGTDNVIIFSTDWDHLWKLTAKGDPRLVKQSGGPETMGHTSLFYVGRDVKEYPSYEEENPDYAGQWTNHEDAKPPFYVQVKDKGRWRAMYGGEGIYPSAREASRAMVAHAGEYGGKFAWRALDGDGRIFDELKARPERNPAGNPTHTITGPHGTMVRIWEQDGTFISTFWVNGGETITGLRATHSTLAGARKWADKVIQEHVGREGYGNPTPGEAISAYDEHLATTLDPAFQEATPDEQAAAMTVQDAVENPMSLRDRLVHVVTEYDRKQEGKRGYNRYAIGHYLNAVSSVMEEVDKGYSVRSAINNNFTGRLADILLRAVEEAPQSREEQMGPMVREERNPLGGPRGDFEYHPEDNDPATHAWVEKVFYLHPHAVVWIPAHDKVMRATKVSQGNYAFSVHDSPEDEQSISFKGRRVRWASDKAQIAEEVDYFIQYGALHPITGRNMNPAPAGYLDLGQDPVYMSPETVQHRLSHRGGAWGGKRYMVRAYMPGSNWHAEEGFAKTLPDAHKEGRRQLKAHPGADHYMVQDQVNAVVVQFNAQGKEVGRGTYVKDDPDPTVFETSTVENPSDLGQDAFDAAKDFRLSGAYSETGVANARVAKYGFTKWWNDLPPKTKGKARLLKNWMEGWAAGKRVEKKQGNPAGRYALVETTPKGNSWVVISSDNREELEKIWKGRAKRFGSRYRYRIDWRGEPKPNPESPAAALYEDFHGRPSAETLEIVTERQQHEWLTGLGTLVELKVATVTQLDATISFARDKKAPELCSSEDGRQLYIEGGDQALDLKALRMAGDKWQKDSMVIGILYELTYQTAKGFHKFKLTDYFHKLGEETGVQPTLLYDPTNRLLSISGGQYQVKDVGIVN